MMKRIVTIAGLALALSACSKAETTADAGVQPPTNVAFLYVGPRGDYGWSKSHEDARLYLENYGANVRTTFVESVAPADAAAKIDELYAQGNKIIFATSFDFLDAALKAPGRHPDLWTLACSGFKTARHSGNYMARVEEAEYLTGMIAGKMTKTNKIGMVGALRIYEQMMHMNAFTLGVRSVNPNAQVLVRWVGNWFNPAMETKAVEDLIKDGGVDVIKGLTDTSIPIVTSDGLKTPGGETVWSIGHDNKDYCNNAKNGTCLASSFYNWGPLYQKLVAEIAAGTYPENGRVDYLGSKDMDVVGISNISDKVPAAVAAQVEAKRKEIAQGTFNVFQGPFNYDDGTPWVAEGQKLTDNDLTCTKRFVQGIANFDGPACANDTECGGDGKLTCDTTRSLCVAPDLSGCTN